MYNKWIAHERIYEENAINLLCFAYPGGSASNFAPWKKLIHTKINLIPILYPEREIRKNDPMEESFTLFVEDFVRDNQALFKIPYAFFGYCGGAVLAYEIAIKAKEVYEKEPEWGFISSSEAPEYLRDSILEFPSEGSREDIIKYLLDLKMFEENIVRNNVFLDYYIPLLIADCKMLYTYKYQMHDKLKCGFDIWFGKEDKNTNYKRAEQWKEYTYGLVNMEGIEGGHFFVDANKEYICNKINKRLLKLNEEGNKYGCH